MERVVDILFVNSPDAEITLFLLITCLVSILIELFILISPEFFILSTEMVVIPPDLLFSIKVFS